MKKTIHSEIVKYKEQTSSDFDDIDFSSDSDIPSDMSTSQLRDLIQKEISDYKTDSPKESNTSSSSSDIDLTETPKSSSTVSDSHLSSVSKHPKIKLPNKSKNKTSRPRLSVPQYKELEPINLYSKTKYDLIPLTTERIEKFLKVYDGDICFISPVSKSPQVDPNGNMWRCLSFVESLKKNDFLYFPVYLYDYPSEQVLDIVFLVYVFPVNHPNLKRQFQDLFNLMTFMSKRYSIHNLVYKKDNQYVIKQDKNYSYLNLDNYEDVIKHLCSLNKNTVDEDKVLLTNPLCSTKMEYLNRHITGNELCLLESEQRLIN